MYYVFCIDTKYYIQDTRYYFMKILFTGGGTGGHFYPLIAVAEKINKIAEQEKIIENDLFFISNDPYDKVALHEQGITFIEVPAGKMRLYFSFKNFIDIFKIIFGFFIALFKIFSIYPDVVFAKGGFGSLPTLLAARLLRIPVVIHESDSSPGRVNKWAGKFAKRIAVSFEEAGTYFPKEKVAWTGQPIRSALMHTAHEGAFEYLKLEQGVPVILVLGGSQGAQIINEALFECLALLVPKYQILHQVGKDNLEDINIRKGVILPNNPNENRYKPFGFLNPLAMRMAAGSASIIISRAGSTIFEIASWGIPSIIIPISNSHDDHQRKNAYNYARAGACVVIEESNLTPHLLQSEINRLLGSQNKLKEMSENAIKFSRPDAAEKIAREIVNIAQEHEV